MKYLKIMMLIALLGSFLSVSAQTKKEDGKQAVNSSGKIEVYYFHFTARCNTCKTIEAQAKEDLQTLYPEQVKNGLITFQSLNLDDESTKSISDKLGVSGQTLLLIKGSQTINLTNEGFMYAVVKPEKFKEIINKNVNDLLSR